MRKDFVLMGVAIFLIAINLAAMTGADDVLLRLIGLESKVQDHDDRLKVIEDKLGITPPSPPLVDPCIGIACSDSTTACPDGFVSKCANACNDGICSSCIPSCAGHDKKLPVVILQFDDLQAWWLEKESAVVVDEHIKRGMPVTLGVIPSGLSQRDGVKGGIVENLKNWTENYPGLVEAAVHTYDHDSYSGWSLEKETADIKKGKLEFDKRNISTWSFVPAFDWGNKYVPQAIVDAGLLIGIDASENPYVDSVKDPMIIENGAWYGKGYTSFDYTSVSSMIDNNLKNTGKDYFVLGYHQQDLTTNTKRQQFNTLLDRLKSSGKYRFMTAKQYYDYRNGVV
jgi:peptidoglycan/xylan/chitin deacetylase (PgdA/CDA1 family)